MRLRSRFGILALAILCVVTVAPAAAGDGKVYGEGIHLAEVVKVSELIAHPDDYVGKKVRVEGLVTDVCPKRGCWMQLAGDREFETIRVKVDDGVIVFPMDAKGKRADAEGVFSKVEMTKEQALSHAKHLAEERGETFDPAKAGNLPTVVYQIQGTGAVIR
jgi:hypothetical protein